MKCQLHKADGIYIYIYMCNLDDYYGVHTADVNTSFNIVDGDNKK
jgi:hypothetical protein